MNRLLLPTVLTFWLLCLMAAAEAATVEQIPNPRPSGWTTDLTSTLPAATIAELNRLGDEVKAQTGAELAVVVVRTIDGADPRDFATRLFNHWGIGQAGRDNGVLVFAALDDRAAEIILGQGVDGDAQVRTSEEIMQGEMIPRFRAGDPAGALYQGAAACAQRILGATPTSTSAPAAPAPTRSYPSAAPVSPEPMPVRLTRNGEILFGIGALLALIGSFAGIQVLRYRARRCPHCKTTMNRLDEAQDDAHLESQERIEERLDSVNYEVWSCQTCGHVKKARYSRWFSSYSQCPGCGARTKHETQVILQHATYEHDGVVRVDVSCVNCQYRNAYTYNTPRQQPPRVSSHGISSSGSSFGGGSSAGRGSSGSW